METPAVIAEILKREGVDTLFAYPVNHIIEYAARADIRPVIVRQERIGLHMADAMSRVSSGEKLGVFVMQHGPGTENAYGGVAQAYGESVPILVMPMGYARPIAHVKPNFNATLSFQSVTKSAEPITSVNEISNVMRRAFTQLRNGRPGPALVEVPTDLFSESLSGELDYSPVISTRSGPDPVDVERVAKVLSEAKRLVIFAGQGVHYAKAWPQLKQLAERLGAPVATSLGGKSSFPESHPLALGASGLAYSKVHHQYLNDADVIFGIGCSFTSTSFGIAIPQGKTIVHATLDALDLNKNSIAQYGLVGDAALTLDALHAALDQRIGSEARDSGKVAADIKKTNAAWLSGWMPKLTSNETPISPYRVLWDLANTVDRDNTIITHDAGSPRDQLSPFWKSDVPLSYLGWGKTTQLGYGLGLAMGAKLAHPDKLCINVWGDAAIGFTGMDFETAVRERIPILSILLNNFSMAIELKIMQVSTQKYRATDISGDYAAMARAFGGYGERVTDPGDIIPAIQRGIEQTRNGVPALLEFITGKETEISRF
ncbi:MAG: thiamine pyrophosphate-requiring protein [Gammaproteobacteria bacterium]|nr:thiamine pyrophosphate-requiring protein [Gammaproteobacteria bacterium]